MVQFFLSKSLLGACMLWSYTSQVMFVIGTSTAVVVSLERDEITCASPVASSCCLRLVLIA